MSARVNPDRSVNRSGQGVGLRSGQAAARVVVVDEAAKLDVLGEHRTKVSAPG